MFSCNLPHVLLGSFTCYCSNGWHGHWNNSQYRMLTLKKKLLLPLLLGLEPGTFQSRVQCSNRWAMPALLTLYGENPSHPQYEQAVFVFDSHRKTVFVLSLSSLFVLFHGGRVCKHTYGWKWSPINTVECIKKIPNHKIIAPENTHTHTHTHTDGWRCDLWII